MEQTTSIVEKLYYNIDAKLANECYNGSMLSHLRFEFPSLITRREGKYHVKVGVDHALFPVSFYQVNANNDYIHLHNYLSGVEWNIHIDHGNYTISSFVQMLIDSMPGFTVVLNTINGKLRFSAPYTWRIYPDSTCYDLIGAQEGEEYSATAGVSVFMPFPANLLGINKLLVHTNLPCRNRDALNQPFLLAVPVDEPPFNVVVYNDVTNDSCLLPNEYACDYLEVTITDERGRLVDFNNVGWQLTLFVEYHMEKEEDWIYSLTDVLRHYETTIEQIKDEPPVHGYNLRTKKRQRKEKDGETTKAR